LAADLLGQRGQLFTILASVVLDLPPVRLILPAGQAELSGPGTPIRPSATPESSTSRAVADLADRYAYPSPGGPSRPGDGEVSAAAHRPWIRANMITSADGAASVAGRTGGLSGPADRLVFSVLRSLADVILVGAGTARAERYAQVRVTEVWPQLRTGRAPTPPIAVVSRRLDLDLDGRLLASAAGLARTIVLTTELAPAARRRAAASTAQVIVAGEQTVTGAAAVAALAELGHRRILVEGGPTLLGELTAEGLLDELCLTVSPVLEGGQSERIITAPAGGQRGAGAVGLAGLRLASVFEDSGYLLCRYLRADQRSDQ